MRHWLRLLPGGALAAMAAASACALVLWSDAPDPVLLGPEGIGPLVLGRAYDEASVAARRSVPDRLLIGPGCDGRDEIRYEARLAELPVSVMAMADGARITEVEITLDAPRQAKNEAACLALRQTLGAHFVARFGASGETWVLHKPVSSEHMLRVGPAVIVARWFPTGRSCYVSAVYGGDRAAAPELSVAMAR